MSKVRPPVIPIVPDAARAAELGIPEDAELWDTGWWPLAGYAGLSVREFGALLSAPPEDGLPWTALTLNGEPFRPLAVWSRTLRHDASGLTMEGRRTPESGWRVIPPDYTAAESAEAIGLLSARLHLVKHLDRRSHTAAGRAAAAAKRPR